MSHPWPSRNTRLLLGDAMGPPVCPDLTTERTRPLIVPSYRFSARPERIIVERVSVPAAVREHRPMLARWASNHHIAIYIP
jgi:hypothetical protein